MAKKSARRRSAASVASSLIWALLVFAVLLLIGTVLLGAQLLSPWADAAENEGPPQLAANIELDPEATPSSGVASQAPEAVDSMQPRGPQVSPAELIDPIWLQNTSEVTGIPARALAAYAAADHQVRAEQNCAVGWNTLAGIGWVESQHGTMQGGSIDADGNVSPTVIGIALDGTNDTAVIADTDGGALDGDTAYDRAVGPMQFIPQTWAQWGSDGSGDGVADINNLDDVAYTAARYLCHSGSLENSENWISGVRSYNNSVLYQNQVAQTASYYAELATNGA